MCQEHMLNTLCIFRRHMKLHKQDVEVFVIYVLNFGVHRSILYALLEKARFTFLHTGARCVADILKLPS